MADFGSVNVITEQRYDYLSETFMIQVRGAYLVHIHDNVEEAAQVKLNEIRIELAKRNVFI